jgi:hypothetical protein
MSFSSRTTLTVPFAGVPHGGPRSEANHAEELRMSRNDSAGASRKPDEIYPIIGSRHAARDQSWGHSPVAPDLAGQYGATKRPTLMRRHRKPTSTIQQPNDGRLRPSSVIPLRHPHRGPIIRVVWRPPLRLSPQRYARVVHPGPQGHHPQS